jgi:hypothetical protein
MYDPPEVVAHSGRIGMYDDTTLLPLVAVIHERLTRNQRERHRLRTLLRLARAADDDKTQIAPDDHRTARDREVVREV